MKIEYQFYRINTIFEPVFDFEPKDKEFILYVNYYGICDKIVEKLTKNYKNLIMDNSQAFFEIPRNGQAAFNSARKFFGAPDGSYLYSPQALNRELQPDDSSERVAHLYKRGSEGPELAYSLFVDNERRLENIPLRKMSSLTASILDKIDYAKVRAIRNKNFAFYQDALKDLNGFRFTVNDLNGPLAYPLKVKDCNLRRRLIEKKIYVSTYWTEVLELVNEDSTEAELVNNVIPLPCDQRYGVEDCAIVIEEIKNYLGIKDYT